MENNQKSKAQLIAELEELQKQAKLEIFRDITEQKKAEEILGLSKRVLEASPNHISIIGTDFKYKYVNNAYTKAHGLDADQITGMHVADLLSKQTFETLVKPLLNKCFSGEEIHYESWFTFKKTGSRFMSVKYLPLITEKGHIDSLVVISQDNTEQKKAEESLKESEEKFHTVADFAYDWEYWKNPQDEFIYISPSCERITGYSPNEFKQNPELFTSIIHPDDLANVENHKHKVLDNNKIEPIEFRIITKSGKECWIGHVCQTIYNANGVNIGVRGSNRDITEKKLAELVLQESEEKYRGVIENMIDGFYKTDVNGNAILISPSVSKILGFSEDEIIGKPVSSFYANPDDRKNFLEQIKKTGKVEAFEAEFIRKEKSNIFIETNAQIIYQDGKYNGVEGVFRDVTEQKQAEEAILLEKDKLTNIFKAMTDGVYIVDQEYNIQYVNPVLVKDFGDYQNRKCYEYFHQRSEVCTWCKNKDVLEGKTVRWEWYSEKTKRIYDLIDTPMKNSDGSISKLEIFRDITEQKKAKESLKESEEKYRALSENALLPVIIHDIKGKILYANSKSIEVLKAKNILEIYKTPVFNTIHPNYITEAINAMKNLINKGTDLHREQKFKRFDGEYIDVDVSGKLIMFNGEKAIQVTFIDITERKQAQQALQQSESQLRQIIDLVPHFIFVKDETGKFEIVNKATAEVFGTTVEDLTGRRDEEFVATEEEKKHFRADDLEVINSGKIKFIPKEAITDSENNIRYLQTTKVPFKFSATKNPSLLGIAVDITERVQLEEALQKSEEKFKTVAEFAYDWEFWQGTDGNFIYVSPAVEHITGYTPQEFYNDKDIIKKIIHPDDFPLYSEHQHQEINGKIEPIDFRIITKKGKNRWIGHVCREVVNENGEPIGRRSSNRDITDRVLAENKLKKSEKALKEAQKIARIGSWELDLVDNHLSWSSGIYEIFEIDPEKFNASYEAFLEAIHPDDREMVNTAYTESLKNKTHCEITHRLLLKNNKIKYVNEVCRTDYDEDGKPLRSFGTVQDITKQKTLEQERIALREHLLKSHKMEAIAQLAGGIAHDFNNALTIVLGNIELLNMHHSNDEILQEFIPPIKESAGHMSHLTNQLLAYSRGGKYQSEKKSLGKFIKESIPLIKHSINPDIKITLDISNNSNQIEADSTQLQMMLSEIITNSAEAIEKDGIIKVSTYQHIIDAEFVKTHPGAEVGRYICLSIEDNGHGMDKETLEKIFEPFFTTKFQGRGLGMASVYGIVKNHNGYIIINSEPGIGTKVQIFFPKIEEIKVKKPVEVLTPEKGSGTVLLIEDEEFVMKLGINVLEHLGYRSMSARNGEEALDIVKSFDGPIDLVLMDMGLPDIPGEILYFHLKEVRPNLKVIVCSGYAVDGPAQKVIDAGALDFIQKPYTISFLGQMLSKYITNK